MTLSGLNTQTRPLYSRRYSRGSSGVYGAETALPAFETLAAFGSAASVDIETPAEAPTPPASTSPYESRFKADLTSLHPQDPEIGEPPAPRDQDGFLGNLSALLTGVRSGDVLGAQVAADALQSDLGAPDASLTTAVLDAPGRMLDDLRDLIQAARRGDVDATHRAARRLSRDIHTALAGGVSGADAARSEAARETGIPSGAQKDGRPTLASGAGAAYDTLMELAEASVTRAA